MRFQIELKRLKAGGLNGKEGSNINRPNDISRFERLFCQGHRRTSHLSLVLEKDVSRICAKPSEIVCVVCIRQFFAIKNLYKFIY